MSQLHTFWSFLTKPARFGVETMRNLRRRVRNRLRRLIVKLIPLSQYHGVVRRGTLYEAQVTPATGPIFVGNTFEPPKFLQQVSVKAPLSEWVELHNVRIVGGCPIVFTKDRLGVHADIIDPDRDLFLAEEAKVAIFEQNERVFHLVPADIPHLKLPAALSLVGEYTGNYAHWLLETLPNLVALDSVPEFEDLPLLVDGWIHPVFFETLMLMNKKARPIHRVARWQIAEVDRLVVSTPSSFTAEKRHTWKTGKSCPPDADFYQFNPKALAEMRALAVAQARRFVSITQPVQHLPEIFRIESDHKRETARIHTPARPVDLHVKTSTPRRLYFKRVAANAGNPRMMLGSDRVENLLIEYGFHAVNPATLSFSEQVLLSRQAECVVAPIGASLTNLVFAEPGCKVIIISPYYKGAEYYYFSNLMGILGHELRFVLGPQVEDAATSHHQHKNYCPDTLALRLALEEFLRAPTGKNNNEIITLRGSFDM